MVATYCCRCGCEVGTSTFAMGSLGTWDTSGTNVCNCLGRREVYTRDWKEEERKRRKKEEYEEQCLMSLVEPEPKIELRSFERMINVWKPRTSQSRRQVYCLKRQRWR